jgi:hypothetical protein
LDPFLKVISSKHYFLSLLLLHKSGRTLLLYSFLFQWRFSQPDTIISRNAYVVADLKIGKDEPRIYSQQCLGISVLELLFLAREEQAAVCYPEKNISSEHVRSQ